MWLATKFGFYSIVQKPAAGDEGARVFHVRARTRGDLENILAAANLQPEILEWPAADYRYRIILDAKQLGQLTSALAGSVDYGNFKSMIASTPEQSGKLPAYHKIWSVMANLQK